MRRFLSILSGILLLGAAFTAPANAAVDPRICNGNPGIRVWQDANRQGPAVTLCFTQYGPWVAYNNLNNLTTNLGFGANWNDRITSVFTYNNTGHHIVLYKNANFAPTNMTVSIGGNDVIDNLGVYWTSAMIDGYNDITSSIGFVP